jgi:hypothetical protein
MERAILCTDVNHRQTSPLILEQTEKPKQKIADIKRILAAGK